MGGRGSGSWYRWNSKPTDEQYHALRISQLYQRGIILEGYVMRGTWQWRCNDQVISSIGYEAHLLREGNPHLRVHYSANTKPYDYSIPLTYTMPHYGGKRWWFICPAEQCGRRVSVLYLGNILACRQCWGLAYASQNKACYERQIDKAFKLATTLGLEGNIIDGFYGKKPKGIHWKTYHRKCAALEQAATTSMLQNPVWNNKNLIPD